MIDPSQSELLVMGFTAHLTHTQCAGTDRVRFCFQNNSITLENLRTIEFYIVHSSNSLPYYFILNPYENKMEITYYQSEAGYNYQATTLYHGEYDKDICPENALQYLERLLAMKAFL
jgi:hypothetical protein